MKSVWLCVAGLALMLPPSVAAQRPDYLNRDEVEKVRETQEPNRRVKLFLQFADERLSTFEKALSKKEKDPDHLSQLLDNFIRAVDDAAEALERSLERGGVDLRKTRNPVAERTQKYRARLDSVLQAYEVTEDDLRYDLEDALEATGDLLALGLKIPDEPIPPKFPTSVAGKQSGEGQPEPQPQPGRPTLRRKKEKEKKPD